MLNFHTECFEKRFVILIFLGGLRVLRGATNFLQ
jgi:hypothetical protein